MPTVVVGVEAFAERVGGMMIPRLLFTPNLMGRPFGAPFDEERHRDVALTALSLLETAVSGDTVRRYERPYRPAT